MKAVDDDTFWGLWAEPNVPVSCGSHRHCIFRLPQPGMDASEEVLRGFIATKAVRCRSNRVPQRHVRVANAASSKETKVGAVMLLTAQGRSQSFGINSKLRSRLRSWSKITFWNAGLDLSKLGLILGSFLNTTKGYELIILIFIKWSYSL